MNLVAPELGTDADLFAIECRGVHKAFGGTPVLTGIDLGLPEGVINVILGPSGTGKSVLIKHMIGLLFPDRGDVLVGGQSLQRLTLAQLLALRRRYGILFQDGALFGSMNVFDNVAFPLRQHTDLAEDQIRAIVAARLAEVGLGDAGERLPSELSGGMRKRAGFARALALDPEIVLFDEPDSGLDPVRTALLCDLIAETHAAHGGTYVLITHDIASARRIGQYIAVLWGGVVQAAGPADEIFSSDDEFVRQFVSGEPDGPLGMD